MKNKIIVLKVEGKKLEFDNTLQGYQHLMDYVSREIKDRTPRKIRTKTFASIVPRDEKVKA